MLWVFDWLYTLNVKSPHQQHHFTHMMTSPLPETGDDIWSLLDTSYMHLRSARTLPWCTDSGFFKASFERPIHSDTHYKRQEILQPWSLFDRKGFEIILIEIIFTDRISSEYVIAEINGTNNSRKNRIKSVRMLNFCDI